MKQILVDNKTLQQCKRIAKECYAEAPRKGYKEKYSKGAIGKQAVIHINYIGNVAECAVAQYLTGSCQAFLDKPVGIPDNGYDLKISGVTIDVKSSSHPFAKRLMWPVTKIDKLDNAADILVLARVPDNGKREEGHMVTLAGWVTRDDFKAWHHIARNIGGVVPGTPYMDEKSLYSMEELRQHIPHYKATN